MITTTPENWMDHKTKYCKNCGRTVFKKPIYVRSGTYVNELCFCNDCWREIFELAEMEEVR